jgi:hypothetical protein
MAKLFFYQRVGIERNILVCDLAKCSPCDYAFNCVSVRVAECDKWSANL